MKVFTTRSESFTEIKRKTIPLMILIFSFLFIIGVVVPAVMKDEPVNWQVMGYVLVFFILLTWFATWRSLKRQQRAFETYRLIIDESRIMREQENVPSIAIDKRDIQKIVQNSNGSFTVIGNSKLNAIGIPSQIADYDDVKHMLAEIKTLDVKTSKSFVEKMFVPISLTGAVLIAITSITKNPAVSLLCSFLIVGLMLAGFLVIQLSRNVDRRTKRISWIFLIPLLSYLFAILNLIGEMN
jgi:hypothetical protein